VAAPDAKWGEVPCAFIETRAGITLTKEEVIDHCRKLLASFKVPKIVIFKDLPKTSTGKIQKFVLREEAGSTKAIDQH
ncbi:MAG: AMP-binding enzyme, partial [Betaproteobacteria bacterium]